MATVTGSFTMVPASDVSTNASVNGASTHAAALADDSDSTYIYHQNTTTTKWDTLQMGLASGSTLPPSTYTITSVTVYHRAHKSDTTSLTTATTSHTKLIYNGSQVMDGDEHDLYTDWDDYSDSVTLNQKTQGLPNFQTQIGIYRGRTIIHTSYQPRCSKVYMVVNYTYETYDTSFVKSLGCTGSTLQINYPSGAAGPDETHTYGNENWTYAVPQDANITVSTTINDTYYQWLGINRTATATYETTNKSITKSTITAASTITAYDYLNHIFVGNKHPKVYIGSNKDAGVQVYQGTQLIYNYTGESV